MRGKTHYATYEAPHEGDNCEYWGDPICGQASENLSQYEDDVTCSNCIRLILRSDKYKKITDLLRKAGFEQAEEAGRDYANDYCCVCLDYQKEGETIIVNNSGGIMEQLPTNYYALLGWLLKSRMGSIKLLD
jgi:hypothetical protein